MLPRRGAPGSAQLSKSRLPVSAAEPRNLGGPHRRRIADPSLVYTTERRCCSSVIAASYARGVITGRSDAGIGMRRTGYHTPYDVLSHDNRRPVRYAHRPVGAARDRVARMSPP